MYLLILANKKIYTKQIMYLHSIMYLLIPSQQQDLFRQYPYLHSIMYLLILKRYFTYQITTDSNLHSIMYLLIHTGKDLLKVLVF